MSILTLSRGKMKKWFEKWNYEKKRRHERGQPRIVQYRDENYVSAAMVCLAS